MALSNRDRIGKMFDVMSPALDAFIERVLEPELQNQDELIRNDWSKLVALKDAKKGASGKEYSRTDPYVQLRMLSENITGQVRQGWYPFDAHLGRVQQGLASELREVRNSWAHGAPFTDDDAYRALDTAERLLTAIAAPDAADQIKAIRLDVRRASADKDDTRLLKQSAAVNPESVGLKPWREVLQPHHDVATGNFQASEFAADLYKVASGDPDQSRDYSDPVEFFGRTFLTDGLRDLIDRAVRRLSGDDNASPVINLQTNFGGGKTHSMLSLWHVAAGRSIAEFPQDTQELLDAAGYSELPKQIRRVAIVGNHFSPSGRVADDGTQINTIWGELAWQLGGREAFEIVANADANRTPPGDALRTLFAKFSPALILIDEWVAYARSLVERADLAAGTFDDQFTFAQTLTEAAKGTSGVLLAVSIPASDVATDGDKEGAVAAGDAAEIGGVYGAEALRRLQHVVRRVAHQWRPASSDEAYEIVRRRLFVTPDREALAHIGATARAYRDLYEQDREHFPSETRGSAYEDRIRRTYPIHPELFDRLYEDWSSLERFQRTRGVLRLMNTVIHALWVGEDSAPLIMPGSVPLATSEVNSELTQYLQDSWKPIIDADVDGPNSEPAKIDVDKPLFGKRSVTKRLARAVFFASAPRHGSAHKGIDTQRVFLGTAMPGDQLGNFRSALDQLGDRATYFYAAHGKYWYDLQANTTRTARDQADRLHPEDVWAEIVRRLKDQGSARGDFAAVHVCPEDTADIPDQDSARLVIVHPKAAHGKSAESPAQKFALQALNSRGTAQREFKNMLVFLAADETRLQELERAVRDYLGWRYVVTNASELDLTQSQRENAEQKAASEDEKADSRLLQTFSRALVPVQPDPGAAPQIEVVKVDSGSTTSLAERVARKLGNDEYLLSQQAAERIRMTLDRTPAIWKDGHVSLGTLWQLHAQYAWAPRLTGRDVLEDGVARTGLLWEESFALAAGFNSDTGRYEDLWIPGDNDGRPAPLPTDGLLLVKPDVATKQHQADKAAAAERSGETGGAGSGSTVGPDGRGTGGGGDGGSGGGPVGGGPAPEPDPPVPAAPKRYFGSRVLDPARYAVDFSKVSAEILDPLSAVDGVKLTVRIEIEAEAADGFDEAKRRTVLENASFLQFDQSEFPE